MGSPFTKAFTFSPDLVRARCLSARMLARMSAQSAAAKMGYKNTSMISKMERKTSKTAINFTFVARASLCYGVSVDYLLGMSDYPERDARSMEQLAIYHSIRTYADNLAGNLIGTILQGASHHMLSTQLHNFCVDAQNLIEAVDRVRDLNKGFDNQVKAGAKLLHYTDNLRERVTCTRSRLDKVQQDQNILRQFQSVLDESQERQIDFIGYNYDQDSTQKSRKENHPKEKGKRNSQTKRPNAQ